MGVLGPAAVFALNAVGYAVSAGCLASLQIGRQVTTEPQGVLAQLREGWTEFRSRTWLWLTVVMFAVYHLFAYGPLMVLGPLSYRHVTGGALRWGTLLGLLGAGALLGGILAVVIRPRRPLMTAVILISGVSLAPATLGLEVPFALRCIAFFVAGLGIEGFNVLWNTLMQRHVPPAALSRVTAYDLMGSACLLPVGYAIAGPMVGLIGLGGTAWFGAAVALLAPLSLLLVTDVRGLSDRD